jgi:hypothetical protein
MAGTPYKTQRMKTMQLNARKCRQAPREGPRAVHVGLGNLAEVARVKPT